MGEFAFEADEAMGIRIDYLFCMGVFIASNLVVVMIVGTIGLVRIRSGR